MVRVPQNIRPSAVNVATGLWDMITHPQRTAETLIDTAQGGVDRVVPEGFTNFMDTYVSPRSRETKERQRQVSGAVGEALYDRYGTWRNIRNTMITDPVGSALDVVGLATGAAGLVRGGLAVGSRQISQEHRGRLSMPSALQPTNSARSYPITTWLGRLLVARAR